jgi:glycosyltransferase involved in cell wall biosynthesis
MLKVPEERISVIYEAADPSCMPMRDPRFLEQVTSRYGIQGDFILYVGGLSLYDPRKRIDLLLEAFSLLTRSRKTPLSLVLAGKMGPYGEELKKEVDQRGLTSRVCFTGYISPQNLPPLYNAARIFAFPSAYEGFGLPLVEAMACGTPTVAFRNSSITEVVGNGGILLDKEDPVALKEAISTILSSDEFARGLTQRALSQAQKFSWTKTAVQTLAVYRQVVEEGERA